MHQYTERSGARRWPCLKASCFQSDHCCKNGEGQPRASLMTMYSNLSTQSSVFFFSVCGPLLLECASAKDHYVQAGSMADCFKHVVLVTLLMLLQDMNAKASMPLTSES